MYEGSESEFRSEDFCCKKLNMCKNYPRVRTLSKFNIESERTKKVNLSIERKRNKFLA